MRFEKRCLLCGLLALTSACSSDSTDDDESCIPDDADGVIGGKNDIAVTVSDTAFAVGGVNSGSLQRNITVQNSSMVNLTLTNVGTRPHSFHVECIPSGLSAGCEATSCFPDAAEIPAVMPGERARATFTTPAVEGAYPFTSTEPGDTKTAANGTVTGLIGQFVLN